MSLWDTDSNALLTVLDVPHDVDELLFVGDEGRWLVGAGKCLIVWDILSCERELSRTHRDLSAP